MWSIFIVIGFVIWDAFNSILGLEAVVTEQDVPTIELAFDIANFSSEIAVAAPLMAAAESRDHFEQISSELAVTLFPFESLLDQILEGSNNDSLGASIAARGHELIENLSVVELTIAKLNELQLERQRVARDFDDSSEEFERELALQLKERRTEPDARTRAAGEPTTIAADSSDGMTEYVRMLELQASAIRARELLVSSLSERDEERFSTLKSGFREAIGLAQSSAATLPGGAILESLSVLRELGLGANGAFELGERENALRVTLRDGLTRNRALEFDLIADVEQLVDEAISEVGTSLEISKNTILGSQSITALLFAVAIVGGVVTGWLVLHKALLQRLRRLRDHMSDMARGKLDEAVDVGGSDELSSMASSLEIFRRHASEVQRLNLVENLATDLQSKNDELEQVLGDLRTVQSQIVMREKLAALGELTAGVAHEIKNPLNFVKNFAEASQELVEELLELAMANDNQPSEEELVEIRLIAGELDENLERIRKHGLRADRIVHDMLRMGRGVGQMQSIKFNELVDEHTRLAYHGARAAVDGFRMELKFELGEDVGKIMAIPQDLGRVVLNMVGNACYATHQKRQELEEAGYTDYFPELTVTTSRSGEKEVLVAIRDNGSGIPQELIEKIFNPFFTTKPTDEGTGLGLALSNDIVQQHGGRIQVESSVGEYTEMRVYVPTDATDGLEAMEFGNATM